MTLANYTDHASAMTLGRDGTGALSAFVSVKATYAWDRDRTPVAAPFAPVLIEDEAVGEPPSSCLLRAAEIGPPKPRVDVLLAGAAVFPVDVDQIDVTLAVGTRIAKTLRVFGERTWVPGLLADAVPSKPRPVTRVPYDWRLCAGGVDPEDLAVMDARNPAGSGFAKAATTLLGRRAPSFESPRAPIQSWKTRPAPQGFGPIAAHWKPRAELTGTHDERWLRDRAPLPPLDFNPRFFNVAPEDQQLDAYLQGEEVRLTYLSRSGHDRFRLPTLTVPVLFATDDGLTEAITTVDTVLIDTEARSFSVIGRAACNLDPAAPFVREVVVGDPPAGHRRALASGKRYLCHRRPGAPA